jgi:hypothetical protein
MTVEELEQEKKKAREAALVIGGALVIILGLRSTSKPVLWDASRASFIIEGRYVSAKTIREQILRIRIASGNRIVILTDRLANGLISLEQWRDEMKSVVSTSHILTAALGSGSIAAAAANEAVVSAVVEERAFLDKFAKDIPEKKLSTPTIKARAKSYLLAAGVTFAIVHHAIRKSAGYTEARRMRTAAESCKGCIAYAGIWMSIDDVPPIGSLECRNYCRCFLEYR